MARYNYILLNISNTFFVFLYNTLDWLWALFFISNHSNKTFNCNPAPIWFLLDHWTSKGRIQQLVIIYCWITYLYLWYLLTIEKYFGCKNISNHCWRCIWSIFQISYFKVTWYSSLTLRGRDQIPTFQITQCINNNAACRCKLIKAWKKNLKMHSWNINLGLCTCGLKCHFESN